MQFLIELDHVKSDSPLTPDAGRAFIEQIIFPTIARAEQLLAEKKIVAGGPVVGRIALRLIVEADSLQEAERIVIGLPLWLLAETRVTPLLAFSERRQHFQGLLENLTGRP